MQVTARVPALNHQAFALGIPETIGCREAMDANRHPSVPEVINDPHSAWHSVHLAEALEKAGVKSTCRVGPQVGKSPEADNAAILDFLRRQLFNQKNHP